MVRDSGTMLPDQLYGMYMSLTTVVGHTGAFAPVPKTVNLCRIGVLTLLPSQVPAAA